LHLYYVNLVEGIYYENKQISRKNGVNYFADEEVKCAYKFEISFVNEGIFILMMIMIYFFAKSKENILNIYWYIFLSSLFFMFIVVLIKDIKTFLHNGVYITEEYFFTFSERKLIWIQFILLIIVLGILVGLFGMK